MIMDITCGIFLVNSDNKILVVKASRGNNWSIPKGVMDKTDKSFIECASRELFEETNTKMTDLLNRYYFVSYGMEKMDYYKQKKVKKQLLSFCFKFNNNLQLLNLKCNSFIKDTDIPEVDIICWKDINWCLEHLHYSQVDCLQKFINKFNHKIN